MTDEQMTTPEEPTEATTTGEEQQAPPPEMRTEDALRFAINLFADLAWINLGIRANPVSGEATTNIEQARLAIDAISALVRLTEGRFDPHEVRDLQNMLSTLQLNFVQRATA